MQEAHFDELKHAAALEAARLLEANTEASRVAAVQAVRDSLDAMRDTERVLVLSPVEVLLMRDFRAWQKTSDRATGVFHWKFPKKAHRAKAQTEG